MKKIAFVLTVLISVSYAQALTCLDLSSSLVRRQENSKVLALQNFLFEKGYLKATPNGYFGAGTLAAVQAFQKDKGLEVVGNVGPSTRRTIKNESCSVGQTGSATTVSLQVIPSYVATTPQSTTVVTGKPPVVSTPSGIRNGKRRDDLEKLIKVLYAYFSDSRGVHATPITTTPVDLCYVPRTLLPIQQASTTEVAVIETPVSPCKDYADISYLVPNYFSVPPHDPTLATSSSLLGYTITRNDNNDITLSAKNSEDGAIIQITCNFNGYCKTIKHISTVPLTVPTLASSSRNMIIRDSVTKDPLVLYGTGLTATNTIAIQEKYTRKSFTLGTFLSTDGVTLPLVSSTTNQAFSCGSGCTEKIPFGDYVLTLSNGGGVSNPIYFTMRGFTTSSFTARGDTSVTPKTTNVKVGTIAISSGIPVVIKSLTIKASSTSTVLPSKINTYVLKESGGTGSTVSAGPNFSFSNTTLYENQSRIYDLYINVDEVQTFESGLVTLGGFFTVEDSFNHALMDLPIKDFSFSISY